MRSNARAARGFTLIEMMIVILIISILVSIAIPVYTKHLLHAREAVLKEDLYTLRNAIDQYTEDKAKAPQELNDLVGAGYLRKLPVDPFTNSSESWQVEQDDTVMSLDQSQPGITDVHSGSTLLSSEGTPYNTW